MIFFKIPILQEILYVFDPLLQVISDFFMIVDMKITTILMYGNVVLFKCYKQKLNKLIERHITRGMIGGRYKIYRPRILISPTGIYIALSLANENCPFGVCVTERGNIYIDK